jgi:hypothetical protein
MDVFIDDRPVDGAFAENGTVEDALRHIQEEVCQPDQLVVGVRCDGKDVASDVLSETLAQPATTYERLEVFTGSKDGLVSDALRQASQCLTQTEEACQSAAELLIQGQTAEAAAALSECLRVWQQIHEAAARSVDLLQLDPEKVTVNDEPMLDLIGRPKDVLIEIRAALQAQDHVLLADILQYEFPKVIDLWHALIGRLQREAEDFISGCER